MSTSNDSRTAFTNRRDDVYNDTEQVQRALNRVYGLDLREDGIFDDATAQAYGMHQRKCGFRGADANGTPGETSLNKLGFRVGGG